MLVLPIALVAGLWQRQRVDEPVDPLRWLPGEPFGHLWLQLSQLRKDVVEVDEDGAFHDRHSSCEPI